MESHCSDYIFQNVGSETPSDKFVVGHSTGLTVNSFRFLKIFNYEHMNISLN